MNANTQPSRPAWEVLAQAITERRSVRAGYHGHQRVLCPHALGWKNGRSMVLAYQSRGTTSTGELTPSTPQRWRSMYVDEIEHPTITNDPWETADNYSPDSTCIDHLAVYIDLK